MREHFRALVRRVLALRPMPSSGRSRTRRAFASSALTAAAFPSSAAAQSETAAPMKRMPLADALADARAHLPAIRSGLARVSARMEEARIPEGQWKPLVGVTGQVFGATANNTTGTYVTPGFMDIP